MALSFDVIGKSRKFDTSQGGKVVDENVERRRNLFAQLIKFNYLYNLYIRRIS